jgi:hypothetical protein
MDATAEELLTLFGYGGKTEINILLSSIDSVGLVHDRYPGHFPLRNGT